MTLEFAKKEAERRTNELGTTHYVIQMLMSPDGYIVTTSVPRGHSPLYIHKTL